MARAVYNSKAHPALSLRASTPGGTAKTRVPGTVADVQMMTEEVMNQICRQASAKIPDGLNAFMVYSSHWIEERIGERIATYLGEQYVHIIPLHTSGFTNRPVRTVCQSLRHYIKWSRPSPFECWACWSTYMWGCVEHHDPEQIMRESCQAVPELESTYKRRCVRDQWMIH